MWQRHAGQTGPWCGLLPGMEPLNGFPLHPTTIISASLSSTNKAVFPLQCCPFSPAACYTECVATRPVADVHRKQCLGLEQKVTSDDPSNSEGAISYHTIRLPNKHRISSSSITTEIKACVNSKFWEKQRELGTSHLERQRLCCTETSCASQGESLCPWCFTGGACGASLTWQVAMVRVKKHSQSLELWIPRGASSVLSFNFGGQRDMNTCQA